jgi:predicted pyridoxine 5'-phosphate oxidase superfamily flavin-nucleotide-binding protein
MKERPFFHEGMRELQDRFDGRRVADAIESHRKHHEFSEEDRELIAASPFFFIATAWGEYTDCSMKSGDPGFVRVTGPGWLEYPEYDGNSMYRTLGNIARNPTVGLLFVRFDGQSRRMRINGRATIHDDAATLATHHGARLVVRIECEIYPNCPRYVPDLIGQRASPHVPRPGQGTPPAPEWKHRDYLRDLLPADDPHRQELGLTDRPKT